MCAFHCFNSLTAKGRARHHSTAYKGRSEVCTQLRESVFSFYHVGPRDYNEVIRSGGLYLPSQ